MSQSKYQGWVGAHLRGAGAAEMPRNSGERAAREPRRYRLEPALGDTLARLRMPDEERANPPGPAASKGPAPQSTAISPDLNLPDKAF